MAILSEVKKVITSILNLYPDGMIEVKLNQEYRCIEGENIPYAAFAYASLHSFMEEELQEKVRIGTDEFHNTKYFPNGTGKAAHVTKLIQEQNASKRNNKKSVQR